MEKHVEPAEFIVLIRDEKALYVDSFCGMALSIVYQRQFCIFERSIPDKHLWVNGAG